MTKQEIAEKACISQHMVGFITAKLELHPLIHTIAGITVVPNIEHYSNLRKESPYLPERMDW
jgi:hypothetical protein